MAANAGATLDGMVTVTVTLEDDVYAALEERAGRIGQPVEVLLAAMASRESRDTGAVTEEFMAEVRQVIEDYRPVLRRLAE